MASLIALSSSIGCIIFVIVSFFQGLVVAGGVTFTFTNRCGGTVWPGVLANSGSAPLETTGFALASGEARSLAAPAGWSGRFWARTGCALDEGKSGSGKCATGDCGSGEVECHGSGAEPPATLVEFTLAGGGSKEDYYDVSLVDGYNVPVVVEAAGCPATGCLVDLNERCPSELSAAVGQGCRSACEAFGRPEYCCSGDFGNPDTCHPSTYSQAFKAACPRAYSYAYDDATSTFTCSGSAAYSVTFCPRAAAATPSSLKSSNDPLPRPGHSSQVSGTEGTGDGFRVRESVAAKNRERKGYTSLDRSCSIGDAIPFDRGRDPVRFQGRDHRRGRLRGADLRVRALQGSPSSSSSSPPAAGPGSAASSSPRWSCASRRTSSSTSSTSRLETRFLTESD